ncbi:MAG TPA: site-specific integrase, partial [Methylocystis sp.]
MRLMSESKASKLPAASAFLASAEVGEEAARWLGFLAGERRSSRHTIDAYGRDVRFFLGFLAEHQGGLADFAALKALEPADLRAFLAKRRNEGLESRSLLRALAAVRSFLRFLEKKGLAKTDLFGAVRAPKRPRSL